MSSTHFSLHYHIVFSTKNREPWLQSPGRERVHEYIGGIVRAGGGVAHAVGGVADHIHLLAGLKATHCLADFVRTAKAGSSKWVRDELKIAGFAWQEGYGAFTVSAGLLEAARKYVFDQETHHRGKSFQQEYLALLRKGAVEYDERYLW